MGRDESHVRGRELDQSDVVSHVEKRFDHRRVSALGKARNIQVKCHRSIGDPHRMDARVRLALALHRDTDPDPGGNGIEYGFTTLDLEHALNLDPGLGECILEESARCRTPLAKDEALSFQIFHADRSSCGPRMVAGNDQHDAGLSVGNGIEPLVLSELRQDGDIGSKGQQPLLDFVAVSERNRKCDLGVALTECNYELSDLGDVCRPNRADPELASQESGRRAQALGRLFFETEDTLRHLEQAAAGVGELDAMPVTAKELDAKSLFERLDVGRDARLTHEQSARSRSKATVLRHSMKAAELVKVDFQRNFAGWNGTFLPGRAPTFA